MTDYILYWTKVDFQSWSNWPFCKNWFGASRNVNFKSKFAVSPDEVLKPSITILKLFKIMQYVCYLSTCTTVAPCIWEWYASTVRYSSSMMEPRIPHSRGKIRQFYLNAIVTPFKSPKRPSPNPKRRRLAQINNHPSLSSSRGHSHAPTP